MFCVLERSIKILVESFEPEYSNKNCSQTDSGDKSQRNNSHQLPSSKKNKTDKIKKRLAFIRGKQAWKFICKLSETVIFNYFDVLTSIGIPRVRMPLILLVTVLVCCCCFLGCKILPIAFLYRLYFSHSIAQEHALSRCRVISAQKMSNITEKRQ